MTVFNCFWAIANRFDSRSPKGSTIQPPPPPHLPHFSLYLTFFSTDHHKITSGWTRITLRSFPVLCKNRNFEPEVPQNPVFIFLYRARSALYAYLTDHHKITSGWSRITLRSFPVLCKNRKYLSAREARSMLTDLAISSHPLYFLKIYFRKRKKDQSWNGGRRPLWKFGKSSVT